MPFAAIKVGDSVQQCLDAGEQKDLFATRSNDGRDATGSRNRL